MNGLLDTGTRWWDSIVYDQVNTAPSAQTVAIWAPGVTPKVDLHHSGVGSAAGALSSGEGREPSPRQVLMNATICARPSADCIVRLESVEDPNSTAVIRIIHQWFLPGTTSSSFDFEHPSGIAIPVRDNVPAADEPANLQIRCLTAAGASQNFATVFGSGTSMSLLTSGVQLSAARNRWRSFNG